MEGSCPGCHSLNTQRLSERKSQHRPGLALSLECSGPRNLLAEEACPSGVEPEHQLYQSPYSHPEVRWLEKGMGP